MQANIRTAVFESYVLAVGPVGVDHKYLAARSRGLFCGLRGYGYGNARVAVRLRA
jgi:hypothetical protein